MKAANDRASEHVVEHSSELAVLGQASEVCHEGRHRLPWMLVTSEELETCEIHQRVGTGGPVPCSYYTAPSRRLSSDRDLQMCVVEKKSAVPLSVEVAEAGSILRWEFQTENYDIGFGVFFAPPDDGKLQELVAMTRVNCHLVPEDGMLVCSHPGKYVLKFDNSFSWYRSKKLLYHFQVLPPSAA
ncbi:hypothetical protein ISCGN_014130 [Ixodes scapularis]